MSENRQYYAVFLHLQYKHLIKKDVDTCLEASQQNNKATVLEGLLTHHCFTHNCVSSAFM